MSSFSPSSESRDSDEKSPTPPDSDIELCLRGEVKLAKNNNELENLSVNNVRNAVTDILGLRQEFLRTDVRWKPKSKAIIHDEVSRQEDPNNSRLAITKSTTHMSSKRRFSQLEPESRLAKRRRKSSLPRSSEEELGPDTKFPEILGETPPSEIKRKSSSSSASGGKQKPNKETSKLKRISKAAGKAASLSLKSEEVKRLQSQLQKCGVRRFWGKDLAQYDTPAEKIAHLKSMLREAGMEGRFSEEKARQIKEERELKADLDDIQHGEERWGRPKREKPRQLIAKGLLDLKGIADDEEDID